MTARGCRLVSVLGKHFFATTSSLFASYFLILSTYQCVYIYYGSTNPAGFVLISKSDYRSVESSGAQQPISLPLCAILRRPQQLCDCRRPQSPSRNGPQLLTRWHQIANVLLVSFLRRFCMASCLHAGLRTSGTTRMETLPRTITTTITNNNRESLEQGQKRGMGSK